MFNLANLPLWAAVIIGFAVFIIVLKVLKLAFRVALSLALIILAAGVVWWLFF